MWKNMKKYRTELQISESAKHEGATDVKANHEEVPQGATDVKMRVQTESSSSNLSQWLSGVFGESQASQSIAKK